MILVEMTLGGEQASMLNDASVVAHGFRVPDVGDYRFNAAGPRGAQRA